LLRVNRQTGKILWDKAAIDQEPIRKDDGNSWATPTPVTDGERVYLTSFNGAFVAVDFEGQAVWTNLSTRFYLKHGLVASPLLYGDTLVLPCDGTSTNTADPQMGWQKPWDGSYLVALDKRTGEVRWKTMRGMSRVAFSSPNLAVVDGRPKVVSGAGDVVQGFDLETGERVWSYENYGEGLVPSVVVGDNLIFCASSFNTGGRYPEAVRAFPLGKRGTFAQTNAVWQETANVPKITSFAYSRPYLFILNENGALHCLRAETGEVVWRERLNGKHEPSPVLAEGRLYLLSSKGKTTVIEAGPEFKKLAENSLEDEKTGGSMAVSGGCFFIRSERNLYCIGKRN
jgi:outer membrane protein assembly factor BamB